MCKERGSHIGVERRSVEARAELLRREQLSIRTQKCVCVIAYADERCVCVIAHADER